MKPIDYRAISSRSLVTLGGVAMLGGALDPMEGSLAILIGSAMVAVGTFVGKNELRQVAYRTFFFVLIAIGVGAMWALSSIGGIGGNSGHSLWWGLLIVPYLIGWSLEIWALGNPRWLVWLGIPAGIWYVVLSGIVLRHSNSKHDQTGMDVVVLMGSIGLLTIGGCIYKLLTAKPQGKLPGPLCGNVS